ncbi:MAG TPA: FAD-dependent oxidoreductase [Aromatoleum sp.]|uniref:FAD-dependent oxidoreductase n=1 Tax=Aromatoleum sp. TaxID=2307007 RepID=UPI002B45B2BE|nr:FAD-dependent oxidoreductase [Aromatoleum sp.]HJV24633.1 FAD-dependent oxidoreductase [Aromatoleum sp.]
MDTISIWRGTAENTTFPPLEGRATVDVAIVGGGITGLTLAMLLAEEGKSVVVLEAGAIGLGSTGNSTGNLYAVVSERLFTIGEKWDREVMRAVAESRSQAVDLIERTAGVLSAEVGFARRDFHLYATTAAAIETVEREYLAAHHVRLPARLADAAPIAVESRRALIIENQAQFHPLAYLQALAQRIASDRCRIYERSAVIDINEQAHTVHTMRGVVSARDIVLATHSPKGRFWIQAEMLANREYGIAARLNQGAYPQGIFWGLGDYFHSVRSLRAAGQEYLIVVGEEHRVGQHDSVEAYLRLEEFVRRHFDVAEVRYRWSAQNYHAADSLPYIGRSHASDLFVATGFGPDGLTYGTLAAAIIADQIVGRPSPWAEIYRAGRIEPVRAALGVLEEGLGVAKALIQDYGGRPAARPATIRPGEGAVVEVGGEKVAAYRDAAGNLSAISPVCTHMKCMVHWNAAEKTWDCPCHGSRFDVTGEVIEGPAVAPLARKQFSQWQS